jgi:hypothetical protein
MHYFYFYLNWVLFEQRIEGPYYQGHRREFFFYMGLPLAVLITQASHKAFLTIGISLKAQLYYINNTIPPPAADNKEYGIAYYSPQPAPARYQPHGH